jgi:hypothetical protein
MQTGAPQRDGAIDVWRGVALVTIFVNHVPGNPLEHWTSRNFGLSDAAEAFVLIAGYSAAVAYLPRFADGRALAGLVAVLRRVVGLYSAHLATLVAGVAVFAEAVLRTGDGRLLELISLTALVEDPLGAVLGAALLGWQPGYLNILPLYVVLMASLPLWLALAARSIPAALGLSGAIYVAANLTGFNLPSHTDDGGWFFNPLAWQFLFVIGVCLGAARVKGVVPRIPGWFVWTAGGYLLASLVVVRGGIWPEPDLLPLPSFLWEPEKTFQTLPRLLHVLALALVVVRSPLHAMAGSLPPSNPLALLGRHALPVFCLGSVLSLALYARIVTDGTPPAEAAALVVLGIIVQVGLAWLLSFRGPSPRGDRARAAEAAG